MALFNFRLHDRKPDAGASSTGATETVDALRRRARHRLIGAVVLVLAAVIGFPLVFDTQPRPVVVDVVIQIPDRARVKPLAMPTLPTPASAASAPATSTVAVSEQVAASASVSVTPKGDVVSRDFLPNKAKPIVERSYSATKSEVVAAPEVTQPVTAPVPAASGGAPAARSADDGSRARALLEGKDPPKPGAADAGRFVVQVGAFSDAAKMRETRLKVERAGLTTYIQVVETADGKRTRVRVGPFSSRSEADKAAVKIRSLDLPASILTL